MFAVTRGKEEVWKKKTFTNKPLLNEPGIKESYKHFGDYNEIIRWANFKISVFSYLNKNFFLKECSSV
mgnify:CR=1 FL=1